MLTAETIIGKVVTFVAQKAASRIFSLASDKRKKACRALTKLYYCVQALDDVTESIFHTASSFRSTKTGEAFAVMNALNNHMHEVALASNMFIDLGHELRAGLEIIDPALAQCCDALYVSKFDFLTEMSRSLEWNRSGKEGRIVIKMPSRTVESEMLERGYAETLEAYQRGEKAYWPDTWAESTEPPEIILTWEYHAAAAEFLQRLADHRKCLVDAKKMLRELLSKNFTVDELLFQTDSHSYR
jgi:hypothetical protein